ncbi:uncharacterized protein B0P05DRAFT_153432 [Gilbertella persicaria]|uniref:uncharacterized protein n=1 Tax=Gilbertella persicaria TaxID=101096 RepID=UPI00221EAC59|nr:uncharacterized protein B0P05DRAFT_153432 [Gilbertella persicaria]KAI8075460.1 hypothetical protein B0P05DRAFT_153432 [Gilbertella persicaria]
MYKSFIHHFVFNKKHITPHEECVLLPAYGYKDPKDPSVWIVRIKGWTGCFRQSTTKQKILQYITQRIAGKVKCNKIVQGLFEERFQYFLANGKSNRQVHIMNHRLRSTTAGLLSHQIRLSNQEEDRFVEVLNDTHVELVKPAGISIISDIDDTIKQTGVSYGAKAILNYTFFNPTQCIEGMADLYMQWYHDGASFHYVSNSPIQLTHNLTRFIQDHRFPPGSLHLKHHQGVMSQWLQAAGQSKKESIQTILKDFPQRKFILVGDSSEIDLDIYTQIAMDFPDQILKIYIRNATSTPSIAFHRQLSPEFTQLSFFTCNNLHGYMKEEIDQEIAQHDDNHHNTDEEIEYRHAAVTDLAGFVIEPSLTGHLDPIKTLNQESLSQDKANRLSKAQKSIPHVKIVFFNHPTEIT